ncbi:AsmA family protein [Burkholderia sp. WAC0059]|uniref:DUF748 domain-containing protein n=1 Tax=Burkholderia sp. WAC0059 TaxID=2066022 RepID=UPI000C7F0838|nr:DUF748 domain-containing protein [Burkholderia sp. WAC0059]PLZ00850.1 AsmA family protein [Burkholderia sp. WAC0059]
MASLDKTALSSSLQTARAVVRAPRTRRIVVGIAIFLVVFGLLGFFAAPPLIRNAADKQLSQLLGRPVTIGRIALNPYTLNLEADQVHIGEPGGNGSFFDAARLVVRPSWFSLLRMAPIVNEVQLESPHVSIVRLGAQRFNFTDLIEKFSTPSKPGNGKSTPFSVSNIRIDNGRIDFDDQLLHEKHVIDGLSVGIPFIATLPSKTDIFVQPLLRMRVDGSPIELDGKTKPFAASRESEVELRIDGLDVPRLLSYAPEKLPVTVGAGKLSTDLKLDFVMSGETPSLRVSGTTDLDGLDVSGPDNAPFFGARRLHVAAATLEPLRSVYRFDDIELDGPSLSLSRDKTGTLSVERMFASQGAGAPAAASAAASGAAPAAATAAKAAPLDLAIRHFAITGGTVHLHDETPAKPVDFGLSNVAATLDNFSSTAKTDARYTFGTGLDSGGSVAVSGAFGMAAKHADAKIDVTALSLPPLQPWLDGATSAQIGAGQFGANVNLSANWANSPAAVQVGQSVLTLTGLKVMAHGTKTPAIALGQGQVQVNQVDLAAHTAEISAVDTTGLQINVERRKDGSIDLTELAAPPRREAAHARTRETHGARETRETREAARSAAPAAPTPWHYRVDEVSVQDGDVEFVDRTTPRPAKLSIKPLQLKVQQISDDLGHPLPIDLKATLNRKGTLALNGEIKPTPLATTLRIDANRLDVAAFEPYFGSQLNATIASALLNARGQLAFDGGSAMRANWRGNAALVDVRMLDKATSDSFAGWRSLALSNLRATYDARRGTDVSASRVTFAGFYGRVLLDPQGRLNLTGVVASQGSAPQSLTRDSSGKEAVSLTPRAALGTPANVAGAGGSASAAIAASTAGTQATASAAAQASVPASAPAAASAAAAAAAHPPVRLHFGELVLQNGSVNYTDHFITPNYSADLVDIHGRVGAFGTQSTTPAPVDVSAQLSANGPLSIKGTVDPLIAQPSLDLTASANDIELTNLTPYSAKYAGYPITKGKLNVDLHYQLANNQLTANNHIFIDQLTFGDHVVNSTETKLPVRLAISLLKNSRGQIDVNIPVSGSLSDPQFSVGGLIWHAFLNLIERAVTAPFSLLANAFSGGGGEDLGYVAFAPGSATLSDADDKKLDTIARALADKPAVKIDLIGRVDPAVDSPALREQYVDSLVRQQKVKSVVGNGESVDLSTVTVDPKEYDEYLTKAYKGADFKKPRNLVGMTKTLPAADMKQALEAHAPVDEAALRDLAQRRAQAVQQYFQGKVDASRVFVVAPKLDAKGIQDKGATTRVDFGLNG